jgi:cytochrome b involved in lipid metabolism
LHLQNKQVYDISNWADHPGGSVIFTHAGDDMTDAFNLFHPPAARAALDQFYIGEIDDKAAKAKPLTKAEVAAKDEQRKFELAYRDLRGKMIAAGLFKLNYW